MTWGSFLEFCTMLELGQTDSVYRNYDVGNLNGSKPGMLIDRAFARMGFDQKNTARPFVLPMVQTRLRDYGFNPPDLETLGELVRSWYNWDRIRKGDLQRFPFRSVTGNLLLGRPHEKGPKERS